MCAKKGGRQGGFRKLNALRQLPEGIESWVSLFIIKSLKRDEENEVKGMERGRGSEKVKRKRE